MKNTPIALAAMLMTIGFSAPGYAAVCTDNLNSPGGSQNMPQEQCNAVTLNKQVCCAGTQNTVSCYKCGANNGTTFHWDFVGKTTYTPGTPGWNTYISIINTPLIPDKKTESRPASQPVIKKTGVAEPDGPESLE